MFDFCREWGGSFYERPTWRAGIKKSEHLNEDTRVDGVVRVLLTEAGTSCCAVLAKSCTLRDLTKGSREEEANPLTDLLLPSCLYRLVAQFDGQPDISCQQDVF